MIRDAAIGFAGGAFGGLVNALFVWIVGLLGITAALGIEVAPPLAKEMIYSKVTWGGVFGFFFMRAFLKHWRLLQGLVISLLPTLVQLVIVFPVKTDAGFLGLGLGSLTPVLVLVANAVWGLAAGAVVLLAERGLPERIAPSGAKRARA